MLTKEQLKLRFDAFHEHFTFKDFLGLSALIFGLLMSNSSFEAGPGIKEVAPPSKLNAEPPNGSRPEVEASQKQTKKRLNKKVLQAPKKNRQPVTASSVTS